MAKPIIVGITGGSASGKTLFMKRLLASLPDASLHSMDNYYFQREQQQKDEKGIPNFDRLESIDIPKYIEDLKSLIDGKEVEIKEYTFNHREATPKIIKIASTKIILVEGIFVLTVDEIRELLDLKLFVDAPEYLMLSRRIKRDLEERGYDLNDVIYRYYHHVSPAYNKHIAPARQWADLVIPNYGGFDKALEVIIRFLDTAN